MKMRLILPLAATVIALASCSGSGSGNANDSSSVNDEEAFYATQPVRSAQYRADYYNISGDKARKGHFDGRIIFIIDKDQSGFFVYENGNRTKIEYRMMFDRPFEKGDSGIYTTFDKNGKPVTVRPDSAGYNLAFEKNDNKIEINFEKEPLSTFSSFEAMKRITEELSRR